MNVPFLGDRLHVKKIEERRKDIMDYVKAFVVGGIICAIVQILMEKTKLMPGRIMVMLVCTGALLGTFCAFRLARFNVKVSAVHGYFEGLPCPTTGVIVAAYVLSGIKIWNWLAMLCVLALAFLMVSEIHYPDNKGASADQLHLPALLGCLAFFLICTIIYWPAWAAALCAAYIIFGIINTYLNRRKAKRKQRRLRMKRRAQAQNGDTEGNVQ